MGGTFDSKFDDFGSKTEILGSKHLEISENIGTFDSKFDDFGSKMEILGAKTLEFSEKIGTFDSKFSEISAQFQDLETKFAENFENKISSPTGFDGELANLISKVDNLEDEQMMSAEKMKEFENLSSKISELQNGQNGEMIETLARKMNEIDIR